MNSTLNENNIREYLPTNDKRNIYVFDSIDSTNNFAKKLAAEGEPHGTAVAAEMQTSGRGRLGRSFCSPSGGNIYMSVILRRDISIEKSMLITPCAAVAVADAIDSVCGTETKIKWVNDLFLGGRKICGILTEASLDCETKKLGYAVVGIGINLASIRKSFPKELIESATSIEDETGKIPDRFRLIAEILRNLDEQIGKIEDVSFMDEYRRRSFLIGRHISVVKSDGERMAEAVGIDDSAGLVVRYDDKTVETLNSGEARILKYGE